MTTDPFIEAAMKHLAAVDHDKSRDWFDGFVACTAWARTHLAAQEPKNAGPHELDEDAPIRNLGYYRSATRCLCGYEVIWGEHDGDAGLDEAWRVHLTRSNVSAARAVRRDKENR